MNAQSPHWARNKRIAVLNWRDAGHPQAGGAETYCLAVCRWLAGQGAQVTLVTSRAPGQARSSVEEGVTIRRGGGQFGVYLFVFGWLLRRRPIRLLRRQARIDAVLDCQNGIPFFSPAAVGRRVPVVLLLHHVHQEQFDLHFGRRLAGIGRFLEGPFSRFVYGSRPTIAVSPSTRAEIRRHLRFRTPIYVVPNGGPTPQAVSTRSPSAHPTAVSVGRLVVQKQVDQLLEAVTEARRSVPDLVFHVVGVGPELESLRQQARDLGLGENVVFHGRVSDAERDAILDQAWVFLSASQREGWGVAVLEAAAHGVPALVRDVPGLRDAVRDRATGWLLSPDRSLSAALVTAIDQLRDETEMTAMSARCQAWARNFSWERTSARVSDILENESERIRAAAPLRAPLDLVTRVEITARPGVEVIDPMLRGGRLTDEWRRTKDGLIGVLYGTDEDGARRALARLGLGSDAVIKVARSHDLLGDLPAPLARRAAIEAHLRLAPSRDFRRETTAVSEVASRVSGGDPPPELIALTSREDVSEPGQPHPDEGISSPVTHPYRTTGDSDGHAAA